jgi:type I restriction enzyme S subunit
MSASLMEQTKSLHVPAAYGEPPNSWTWSRLDDVSEGVFDCPHSTPKLTNTGPFVVRTQDIITGVFRADQAGRVSEETYADRIARVTPSRGDLLYSREGTYFGIAAEVPEETRVCLGQRMVLIRPDKRRLDFSFLCHWLNSPIMAAHIHGYRDGTVAERLNLPTIRALPVLIPPLAEQKAIAGVLGALDDKIESNRRMNVTLEAMARALFQSWFVDFDPVRAKLNGRKPAGIDGATAALFPDSFQESSLGAIPRGWEVCPLSEKIQLLSGGTPKTSEPAYWEGDIPWYSVRDAPTESDVWVIRTDKHVTKHGITNSAAQIFPEKTTIISARGTVGRLALTAVPMAMNQSCYGVRGIAGYTEYFTYYSLREATAQLQQRTHGTVFDTITTETFKTLDCIFPTPKITTAFDKLVEPLLSQIRANLLQSRTLAALRNTLLPKLLTGELNLAKIEDLVHNPKGQAA